jgi:hypothetical protein
MEREALAERRISPVSFRSAEASRSISKRVAGTWLALCAIVVCSTNASVVQRGGDDPARVLFIGNSLTAANDLPALVESMSASVGSPLRCEKVTFGGFSLEDHWNEGSARRAIAKGGWSTVVLQQGPSSLPESRVLLIEYVRRFDAEIRRAGPSTRLGASARTALYMVWPAAARRSDFDGVKASYEAAARAVGGLFLPAGEAWREAWRIDSRVALYGPDGFHPTLAGSSLAALVIVRQLTGRSVDHLPATIPAAEAAILKRAAAQTVTPPR